MNKKGIRLAALALATCLMGAVPAYAEQVTIPVGAQGDHSQSSLPANGITQDAVRERWGSPEEIREPVGQPPISQWHYKEFVVYFEGERVLHTVMKRK